VTKQTQNEPEAHTFVGGKVGEGGASDVVDTLVSKFFYVIYPSAEINHQNRLMTSILEF